MKRKLYYNPSLPESIEKAIDELFTNNPTVANLFDNNKVRFIAYCVQDKVIELDRQNKIYRQIANLNDALQELKRDISESD